MIFNQKEKNTDTRQGQSGAFYKWNEKLIVGDRKVNDGMYFPDVWNFLIISSKLGIYFNQILPYS